MKTMTIQEVANEVTSYQFNSGVDTKQKRMEYENVCDFVSEFTTYTKADTITLDFDTCINFGDVLKSAYLYHLNGAKNPRLKRTAIVVEKHHGKTYQVLTHFKSKGCKVSDTKVCDYVKYIIFTKTVKAVATVDFDKVVGTRPSVGAVLKMANNIEPLVLARGKQDVEYEIYCND